MSTKVLMMSKKKRAALQKQIIEEGRKNLKELQELMGPLFGRRVGEITCFPAKFTPKYRAEDTSKYPSLDTGGSMNATGKKSSPTYTGDKLKGIATMHKSNMVPIFSDEEAVEVARMRRN